MIKVIETNTVEHQGGQTTETINHYINEAHIAEIKEADAPYAMNEVVLDNGTVIETPMSVEELLTPYNTNPNLNKDDTKRFFFDKALWGD